MSARAVSGAAIGIVCKAPQAGLSKTRLAKAVGAAAASELSACFLRDVAASIEAVPEVLRGYGVYAPAGGEHITITPGIFWSSRRLRHFAARRQRGSFRSACCFYPNSSIGISTFREW